MTSSLLNRAVHRTVLENGIVVLVVENPTADIIAARMFLDAGRLREPGDRAGLSYLLASVMTKGTERLSSLEIAERVESIGASLRVDAGMDYALVGLKTVSADFPEMLHLTGQLMRHPSFPEAEVSLERRLSLQSIRSQKEQPYTIAFEQLRQAMYCDHPYALSTLGTEETMAHIEREDLVRFHQTYFRPDNLVISIAGNITVPEAIAQVEAVFGNWQAPADPLPSLSLPSINGRATQQIAYQDTQQSIIMLGYAAPGILAGETGSQDYITLKLLNTYLGNGLSSRLFVELREKRGLAYDVSAFYPTRLEPSHFVAYMGTAAENTAIGIEGLQREVDRLRTVCLSDAELQTAKDKLLGQYALGKQTNAQLAQIYGWYEFLHLGIEFDLQFQEAIAAVTPEQAIAAANRYFSEPYLSLVGPATKESLAIVRWSA